GAFFESGPPMLCEEVGGPSPRLEALRRPVTDIRDPSIWDAARLWGHGRAAKALRADLGDPGSTTVPHGEGGGDRRACGNSAFPRGQVQALAPQMPAHAFPVRKLVRPVRIVHSLI